MPKKAKTVIQRPMLQDFFKHEITSVPVKGEFTRDGLNPRRFKINSKEELSADENPRQTTLEKLAKLPAIFSKEGPTTAGSASGIVDGAASALVASGDFVKTHGVKPLGKIHAFATVGVDPKIMGIGPFPAIELVLEAAKMQLSDIDLFEINEAFGAQCLSVRKALEIDSAKLNIHGGAIAIGHPLAATGLRLVLTLLHSLRVQDKTMGMASACIGGGQGIAVIVERT